MSEFRSAEKTVDPLTICEPRSEGYSTIWKIIFWRSDLWVNDDFIHVLNMTASAIICKTLQICRRVIPVSLSCAAIFEDKLLSTRQLIVLPLSNHLVTATTCNCKKKKKKNPKHCGYWESTEFSILCFIVVWLSNNPEHIVQTSGISY